MVSPGRTRRFITAVAVAGRTVSCAPAVKIVGAIVVRIAALVIGEAANWRVTTGSKSQRLANASFLLQTISGPRNSSICRVAPLTRGVNGVAASFSIARLSTVMAPSAGGIEL